MRTLAALPRRQAAADRPPRPSRSTRPLANRLGIQEVKWELEDLAFQTLHPRPYKEIAQLVETRRDERTRRILELTDTLRQS